jgi:hypothetical protein
LILETRRTFNSRPLHLRFGLQFCKQLLRDFGFAI